MREVILAVDTCGPRPRVALRVDARVTTADSPDLETRADDAAALAQHLFRTAGVSVGELSGIGVTIGPGSYTGVRVGLALVRGLSLVDRVPVIGVGTLELLALAAPVTDLEVCPLLDGGSDKIYAAVFERSGGADGGLRELVAPRVLSRPDAAAFVHAEAASAVLVCCGDEREIRCGRPVLAVAGSRVAVLAEFAARRLRNGGGTRADLVLPRYVGATGARPNRNKVATASLADE